MQLIIAATVITTAFFAFGVSMVVRAQKKRPLTGQEGMIGEFGEAISDISPVGQVMVQGEIWKAKSRDAIQKGEEIKVVAIEGLKLFVEKRHSEQP